MSKIKYKELLQEHFLVTQQINKKQEILLLQQLGYLFTDNPITDFWFEGLNKHIFISGNFETPNFEVMINVNGYISITDNDSTEWYQVTTESQVQSPYASPVIDFGWSGLDIDSIINSFTAEADLHRIMELLEVEVSTLKQRLWLLKNSSLRLETVEDEKLIRELTSLKEVA